MADEVDDTGESLEYKARRIMSDMRYQIFGSTVTTMGTCSNCPGRARGARTCSHCLTRQLAYIVGDRAARDFHTTALTMREAELQVLNIAERGS